MPDEITYAPLPFGGPPLTSTPTVHAPLPFGGPLLTTTPTPAPEPEPEPTPKPTPIPTPTPTGQPTLEQYEEFVASTPSFLASISDISKEVMTLGGALTETFNLQDIEKKAEEAYESEEELAILKREEELVAGMEVAKADAIAIYEGVLSEAIVDKKTEDRQTFIVGAQHIWSEGKDQAIADKQANRSSWLAERGSEYDVALTEAKAQGMILTETRDEFLARSSTFYDQSPIEMRDPGTGEIVTKEGYLAGALADYDAAPVRLDITRKEFVSSAMADYEKWAAGVRGEPVLAETESEFIKRSTEETLAAQPSGWDIASYFIPVYGTVKLAQERGMTSGWTIGSAVADIALFLPVIGWGAKAAQVGAASGIRGLAIVPRITTIARSEVFLSRELAGGLIRAPFQAVRHPIQFGTSWMGMTTYPLLHPFATMKAYGRLYTGQVRFGPPRGIGVEGTALMRATEAGVGGKATVPEWQMTEVPPPIAGDRYQLPWPGERFVPHRIIGPEEALFGGPRGWARSQAFAGGAYQRTPSGLFGFKRIPTEPEWFPGAFRGRVGVGTTTRPWGGAGSAVRPTTATMTPEMVLSMQLARGVLPSAFPLTVTTIGAPVVVPTITPGVGPIAPFAPGTYPIPTEPSPILVPTPVPGLGLVIPPAPEFVTPTSPLPVSPPEPLTYTPMPMPLVFVPPALAVTAPSPIIVAPSPPGPPRITPPPLMLPWLPGLPKLGKIRIRRKKAGKRKYGLVGWPFGELFISMPAPFTLKRKKVRIRKKGKLPYGAKTLKSRMGGAKGIRL